MLYVINIVATNYQRYKQVQKLDSILCNGDLSEPESDSEDFLGKLYLSNNYK